MEIEIDHKKIEKANDIGIKFTSELQKLKKKYSNHKDIVDICAVAMATTLCSLSTPYLNGKPHIDKELILNNVNFCTSYISEIAKSVLNDKNFELKER